MAHETTKVGAYFGYGSSDYKANANKIDADNVHFGVYGMSDVGPASITYGFAYTTEDRDTERSLGGFMSAHSEDASVMQLFAEAAYTLTSAKTRSSPTSACLGPRLRPTALPISMTRAP